ncbi:hypothetical protein FOXB_17553 [Fusarium oxysporum f. sp. conglutinans Fo5176]|uniref:Uncharacterized protein n=1 Tax=Fusarium oxysporum (strain Fo5176) TaxID=660025 RepID=F9GFW9_FUSOF|nr:hypothetical protein FOXB_17553 [Fusarium oxysporum f. sp. conglutinans Fo5176]
MAPKSCLGQLAKKSVNASLRLADYSASIRNTIYQSCRVAMVSGFCACFYRFGVLPYCNRPKTVIASARDVLLHMNHSSFILQALFPIPLPMLPLPQSWIALNSSIIAPALHPQSLLTISKTVI